jgi:hypothetical protein
MYGGSVDIPIANRIVVALVFHAALLLLVGAEEV